MNSRQPARLNWLPRFLVVCAVVLSLWIGILVLQLHGQAGHRSLGSAWVGLDAAELCGLLLVARLFRRRRPAVSPVAAATATLFALDAWFDCQSVGQQLGYLQSILMALLAELPLALLLAWVSSLTLAWVKEPGSD